MTVSAARRLTGNGPLTPFEQVIRLLPVLMDEQWNKLPTIIRDHDQMSNSGSLGAGM